MNVRAHSKNREQLRQTVNDGFRGHIRTRESKGESGILINDCERKYLLLEALSNGPLKSKFSRSKTWVALISRAYLSERSGALSVDILHTERSSLVCQ